MQTDHLIIDIARTEGFSPDKLRVQNNLEISTDRGAVMFKGEGITIMMFRRGKQTLATVNGQGPMVVDKYHVSYESYPTIRKALK